MKIVCNNSKLKFKNPNMPLTWDYEILGVYEAGADVENPQGLTQYYYVNSQAKVLVYKNGGSSTNITLTNGMIFKITDYLFAVYNDNELYYVTDGRVRIPQYVVFFNY